MAGRERSAASLLVRNISDNLSKEDLGDAFSKYGEVKDVYLPLDYYTKRRRGFGFVEFVEEADAEEAQRNMDKASLDNRELEVVFARRGRRSSDEMRHRDGGGRRGGYGDRRWGDDRRGGYDDRRGGYDDRRGGYDDRRGGYDDRRGGYDDRQGGHDDRRGSASRSVDRPAASSPPPQVAGEGHSATAAAAAAAPVQDAPPAVNGHD